jgi:hypothetical protein
MAKTNNNADPLFQMNADITKQIEEAEADIANAHADLDAMEKTGLDVSKMRAQLDWAEKTRAILLERYKKRV